MDYRHQNLLTWLNGHTCINLAELERQARLPKDSLRHFTKERRDISKTNLAKAEKILADYGYVPMEV